MNLLKKPGLLLILGVSSVLLHAGCAIDVDDVEETGDDPAAFSESEPLTVVPAAASEQETPDRSTCELGQDGDPYEFRGTRGCLVRCSIRYAYCRDRSRSDSVYRYSRAGDGGCYQQYWRCTRECYSDTSIMLAEQE